jgi:hypothetical protein
VYYVLEYVRTYHGTRAACVYVMRAIGIEVMHKHAYMMATLVQALRSEEQFMADFAHGVVHVYEGRRVWMIFDRRCFCAHLGFWVCRLFVLECIYICIAIPTRVP